MNQYFLQMLAGVYLEPELFLLWRIDQSFITLILRIGPKLASFKNVVLKYELKKKKKRLSKPWKQKNIDNCSSPTPQHTPKSKVCCRWAGGWLPFEYLKVCVLFDFRQRCFASCIFKQPRTTTTDRVNFVLAPNPQSDEIKLCFSKFSYWHSLQ